MGRRPFYSAALAAIILTAISSTIATADNQPAGHLEISPTTAHPGQRVTLEVYSNCYHVVFSAPMLEVEVPQRENEGTRAFARVKANAQPGRYVVSVECHHYGPPDTIETLTARLTVAKASPSLLAISPSSARPGQTVSLEVYYRCSYGATFSSPVLTIGKPEDDYGAARATATVNADAKPGRYEVSAACYSGLPPRPTMYTAPFTVADPKAPAPQGQPAAHQVKQVPKGAAQTGGGGTASQG